MDLAKQKLHQAFEELGESYTYQQLKQDASSRVYFRLPECLAVVYLDKRVPEAGAGAQLEPDVAFKKVGKLLLDHGLLVPKVTWESKNKDVYFIQDYGDKHLADSKPDLFEKALDAARTFSSILVQDELLKSRQLSEQVLRSEMQEIVDFTDLPETAQAMSELDQIASEISELDYCFQHRDFHAWNILVKPENELVLIDFQDSLMAPKGYDVASLLHDRDTDKLLGERYLSLFRSAVEKLSLPTEQIVKVLLQRDLKVVGRFSKLVANKRPEYQKWISGTQFRVGKSLAYLKWDSVLLSHFSEVKAGYLKGFDGI